MRVPFGAQYIVRKWERVALIQYARWSILCHGETQNTNPVQELETLTVFLSILALLFVIVHVILYYFD